MSIKKKAVNGIIWNGMEKFASQGIQFVIGLILARLLLPADYGLLGMIGIFTAISQNFIDSGFSNALIRKHNRTDIDFSTVFYFNIAVSTLCYFVLFFCAPLIAKFYNQPILTPIIRVVSFNIIIGAFAAIQRTIISIKINFKASAIANITSIVIGGIVGILMAVKGFGVWALVAQLLASSVTATIIFWKMGNWKPLFIFSKESFKELFGYGSKLLGAGLLDTFFNNIYYIIIGKFFHTNELGFYTRAQGFANLPSSTLTSIIQKVSFPVLSSIQNEPDRLKNAYRNIIKMTAFLVFPLMIFLATIANPLVIFLLTDKWSGVIILLQMLCLAQMWYPIHAINLNILYVAGRSDLFLKLEVIKKVILVILIMITFSFGVVGLAAGQIALSFIALYINTYYTSRFIDYKLGKQLKDLLPTLSLSLFAGVVTYFTMLLSNTPITQLILGGIAMAVTYIGAAYLFKLEELNEYYQIIKNKLCRKNA